MPAITQRTYSTVYRVVLVEFGLVEFGCMITQLCKNSNKKGGMGLSTYGLPGQKQFKRRQNQTYVCQLILKNVKYQKFILNFQKFFVSNCKVFILSVDTKLLSRKIKLFF